VAKIGQLIADGQRRGRPTVSFEFFPPKSDGAALTLGRTIAELEPLNPSFVSVTYGAGGSTRDRTHNIVTWVRRETPVTPMAHLTCVGHTRDEIRQILDNYAAAGVENILALLGDPPADAADGDAMVSRTEFDHAIDLVEFIREVGDFSVGVAAHPELHPRSPDRSSDRRHLADKLAVADFAISQFFFEAVHYREMVAEVEALGVSTPIVPGVMPVTNVSSVSRMAELSGAAFPQWLADRLQEVADDPAEVRRVGVEVATELCRELLDHGAPGLHLYTLNRSTATMEIHAKLGLRRVATPTA
jgi:methylenetetrahydrofolate reductase (NADPH)